MAAAAATECGYRALASSEVRKAVAEEKKEQAIQEESDIRDDDRRWYVIHTYSGYENKVKQNLLHRIETMEMRDQIFNVIVPTEEEIEIKNGQRRTVQKKSVSWICAGADENE